MSTLKIDSAMAINGPGRHNLLTTSLIINPCPSTREFIAHQTKPSKGVRTSRRSIIVKCASPVVSSQREKNKVYADHEEIMNVTRDHKPKESVADKWREIHGRDDWAGMLDPMDPLLRSELIRYGEMAQSCYDAFDNDPYSKFCGSCKFKPKTFFQDLGFNENQGYEITSYIYSSNYMKLPGFFKKSLHGLNAWLNPAVNWVGYVAVSNNEMLARLGRRDITVAWRGTVTKLDWLNDFKDVLKPVSNHQIVSPDHKVKAEAGFLHVYTDKHDNCKFSKYSAREQVLGEVKRLVHEYSNEELSITITGHSLGGALAILSAYDIAETVADSKGDMGVVPISVFAFSSPRVGNVWFKKRMEVLKVKVLRLFNVHDMVPKVPGLIFNEHTPRVFQWIGEMLLWSYTHVGEEVALDHRRSPFLKETTDLANFHNLEALLHLLDGYHGKGSKFRLASGRDIALVNKHADFLKDEQIIPPNWAQVENKGLRRNPKGRWVHEGDLEDHFPPEVVQHHLQKLGLDYPRLNI